MTVVEVVRWHSHLRGSERLCGCVVDGFECHAKMVKEIPKEGRLISGRDMVHIYVLLTRCSEKMPEAQEDRVSCLI